jgi:hypothetical protein
MPLSVAFCDFRGDAFQSADYRSALVLAPATLEAAMGNDQVCDWVLAVVGIVANWLS